MGNGGTTTGRFARLAGPALLFVSALLFVVYYRYSAIIVVRLPQTLAWWGEFTQPENLAAIPSAIAAILPAASSLLILALHGVAVGFAATFVVSTWRSGNTAVDGAAISTLSIALIVAECLVLGSLGLLYPITFGILHIGFVIACSLALVRAPARRRFIELLEALRGEFSRSVDQMIRSPFGWLLIVSLVLLVPWLLFLGLAFYPTAADVSKYHLPPLVSWWQHGGFFPVRLGTPFADSYPKNVNMLSLFALVVTGDPVFFRLTQLPFALLGTYACIVMARLCGVQPRHAALGGLFFFLTPVVQAQSTVGLVDVAVCVLFLSATLFLMQYARSRSAGSLAAFAVATGLTLGAKFSMIAPAAILITIFLAVHLFVYARGVLGRSRCIAQVTGVGTIIGALGLFWYARNYATYENPVWPFAISILDGSVRFPGTHQLEWLVKQATWNYRMAPLYPTFAEMSVFDALFCSWAERLPFYGAAMCAHGGLGIQWFVFGLPCVMAAGLIAIKKQNLALLLMLIVLGGAWVMTDAPGVARYTLYLGGLGGIAVALMLDEIPIWSRRIYGTAVILALALSGFLASNQQNEQDYLPNTPLRLAESGRLMPMNRMDMRAYESLVPPGSTVGFFPKVKSDVYFFFGHDLSRSIEALPPASATSTKLLNEYPYLIVPEDGPHELLIKDLPGLEWIGSAHPFSIYRQTTSSSSGS